MVSMSHSDSNSSTEDGVRARSESCPVYPRQQCPGVRRFSLVLGSLFLAWNVVHAGGNDESRARAAFLEEVFDGPVPAQQRLWLTAAMRNEMSAIVGRPFKLLRVPHWQLGDRCVFVLDEVAKDRPITTGVSVKGGRIERVEILAYRESRGGEVQSEAFVSQFAGAALDRRRRLDQEIDGITGATLSVRALTRQVRLSLYLYGRIKQ